MSNVKKPADLRPCDKPGCLGKCRMRKTEKDAAGRRVGVFQCPVCNLWMRQFIATTPVVVQKQREAVVAEVNNHLGKALTRKADKPESRKGAVPETRKGIEPVSQGPGNLAVLKTAVADGLDDVGESPLVDAVDQYMLELIGPAFIVIRMGLQTPDGVSRQQADLAKWIVEHTVARKTQSEVSGGEQQQSSVKSALFGSRKP